MTNYPNSDLVVQEWLRTAGLGVAGVASQLPQDNSTWGTSGFITTTVVGGTFNPYISVGRPVMQLDVYTIRPNASKPLWNRASNIMQGLIRAVLDEATLRRALTLTAGPADYGRARVLEISSPGYEDMPEPRKVFGDPGNYARMTIDLQFHWVGL